VLFRVKLLTVAHPVSAGAISLFSLLHKRRPVELSSGSTHTQVLHSVPRCPTRHYAPLREDNLFGQIDLAVCRCNRPASFMTSKGSMNVSMMKRGLINDDVTCWHMSLITSHVLIDVEYRLSAVQTRIRRYVILISKRGMTFENAAPRHQSVRVVSPRRTSWAMTCKRVLIAICTRT
jgi:hypothetical protein